MFTVSRALWLFVVRCVPFWCPLLVVGCFFVSWLLRIRCLLFVDVCWLLCVVRLLWFVASCSLCVARCVLFVVRCVLVVVCWG